MWGGGSGALRLRSCLPLFRARPRQTPDGDSGRLGRERDSRKGKGMAVFMSETLCSSILTVTTRTSLAIYYFLINKTPLSFTTY